MVIFKCDSYPLILVEFNMSMQFQSGFQGNVKFAGPFIITKRRSKKTNMPIVEIGFFGGGFEIYDCGEKFYQLAEVDQQFESIEFEIKLDTIGMQKNAIKPITNSISVDGRLLNQPSNAPN